MFSHICTVVTAIAVQPPEAPTTVSTSAKEEAAVSVTESVEAARSLIDQWDVSAIEDEVPALAAELNRRILALQAADPANPWLPYLFGRLHALNGRIGEAIDQLRRFVDSREGRTDWKAYRVLGDLFIGEFPRLAKANYDRAAELNPSEPTVLAGLSITANKTGARDEALRLARAAVDADGRKRVRFINHLARMLALVKQRDEAEREALAALRLAEADVERQPGRRGPLQVVANQYDLLIEIVGGRAAETAGVNSDDYVRLSDYMMRRAEAAVRLSKHDRLSVLQRGMESLAEPSPRLLESFAAALAEVGRNDEAIVQFEKLLTIEPDNVVAREQLARLRPDGDRPEVKQQR